LSSCRHTSHVTLVTTWSTHVLIFFSPLRSLTLACLFWLPWTLASLGIHEVLITGTGGSVTLSLITTLRLHITFPSATTASLWWDHCPHARCWPVATRSLFHLTPLLFTGQGMGTGTESSTRVPGVDAGNCRATFCHCHRRCGRRSAVVFLINHRWNLPAILSLHPPPFPIVVLRKADCPSGPHVLMIDDILNPARIAGRCISY
jgi:hypothetical protein